MNIKSIISLCLISAICGYYNDLRNMNFMFRKLLRLQSNLGVCGS